MPLQTLEDHSNRVTSVAISPDVKVAASGSYSKTVRLWDAVAGAPLQTLEGHTGFARAVAPSPDGRLAAPAPSDETVRLRDAATGAARSTLEGHTDYARAVAFSPDRKLVASAPSNKTVRLWDATTGAVRSAIDVDDIITQLSSSPDGFHIESNLGKISVSSNTLASRPRPTPSQGVFVQRQRICDGNMERVLWLHPEFRTIAVAVRDRLLVLEHASGLLTFLGIDCI